jgi:hypothetical protein
MYMYVHIHVHVRVHVVYMNVLYSTCECSVHVHVYKHLNVYLHEQVRFRKMFMLWRPGYIIPIPQRRFSHLHVNLVGPLQYSNNFNYIFTIIDRTSKWMEAIPLS